MESQVKGSVGVPEQNIDKSNAHKAICEELNELYRRKNQDYGDAFTKTIDEFGPVAFAVRLNDKTERIKQLIKSRDIQVKDESLRDTCIDVANYCIMFVMWLDFMTGKKGEREE